jgi:hypothetical protein
VGKLRQKEREEGNIERRKEIMKEKICFIPLEFYLCNAGAIGHDYTAMISPFQIFRIFYSQRIKLNFWHILF